MTRRYRTEKLSRLEDELKEQKSTGELETLDFGDGDPLQVPKNECERCGGRPELREFEARRGKRFRARCQGCGLEPAPEVAKKPWAAALDWNGRNLATAEHYTEFPFFGLRGLPASEARAKLVAIRENLERRRKAAGLRRSLRSEKKTNQRPPGKRYQQRLEAYLKWAMYALRLIKFQEADQGGAEDSNQT